MRNFYILILLIISVTILYSDETMIKIAGGEFQMGTELYDDTYVHKVQVDDFYLSKYETTFKEWMAFYESIGKDFPWNKSDFLELSTHYDLNVAVDTLPMFKITWLDAVNFCNWKSKIEDLEEVYIISGKEVFWNQSKNGYRLPTEAEWEFAARGGISSQGFLFSGSNSEEEAGWVNRNSNFKIHPIGQKKPNELGIYDMTGNVAEWCWDYYTPNYYEQSPTINPTGPDIGVPYPGMEITESDVRVLRGSSFRSQDEDVYFRGLSRENDNGLIGLRLARGRIIHADEAEEK